MFTDHRPLSGLERKHITDLDNVRLMRLLEHTSGYNLEVAYIKGIKMAISDVLSLKSIVQTFLLTRKSYVSLLSYSGVF